MKPAAWIFTAAAVAVILLTDVVRSIVHTRRTKVHKQAGTQDVAMIGTFTSLGLGVIAGVLWLLCLRRS